MPRIFIAIIKSMYRFITFALSISSLTVGCNGYDSTGSDVEQELLANKSKWESVKSNLGTYQLTQVYSGMAGYSKVTLVFENDDEVPLSCELEERQGDAEAPTISDCMDQEFYHKNVDDLFAELLDIMSTHGVDQVTYNEDFGVPLTVVGVAPDPLPADAGAPGFAITFEVL